MLQQLVKHGVSQPQQSRHCRGECAEQSCCCSEADAAPHRPTCRRGRASSSSSRGTGGSISAALSCSSEKTGVLLLPSPSVAAAGSSTASRHTRPAVGDLLLQLLLLLERLWGSC